MTAAEGTSGLDDIRLPEGIWERMREDPGEDRTDGSALWEYGSEGTIDGIPVRPADRGLAVSSDDQLRQAFRLVRRPRSLLVSADPADPESAAAYDGLLDRVYRGEAVIVDESRSYDASRGRFVAWVRYDELEYGLNPRYVQLREE